MNKTSAKEWLNKAWHHSAFNRLLPARDEIKEVMDFTQELFSKVCKILDVDKQEVMK
jgi:hypothetical protein